MILFLEDIDINPPFPFFEQGRWWPAHMERPDFYVNIALLITASQPEKNIVYLYRYKLATGSYLSISLPFLD
jgi:hypothetical protein